MRLRLIWNHKKGLEFLLPKIPLLMEGGKNFQKPLKTDSYNCRFSLFRYFDDIDDEDLLEIL
jgi:hypothetical protein